MANLATLPPELLAIITDYYSGFYVRDRTLDQSDLARLSRVNRRLHRVIIPILYDFNMRVHHFTAPITAVIGKNLDTLKVIKSLRLPLNWDTFKKACKYDRYEIIEWLLDNMTVMPDRDEDAKAQYALAIWTAFYWNAAEDTILLLLSRASMPHLLQIPGIYLDESDAYSSALHHAAQKNMLRAVDYLVCDMGMPVDVRNSHGASPLLESLFENEFYDPDTPIKALQIQEQMVKDADVMNDEEEEEETKYRRTYNDTTMLKKLMEFGADINIEVNGRLPLTVALKSLKYNHAQVLINAGSKLKPSQPVPGVRYPIHMCIRGRGWTYDSKRDWELDWEQVWEHDSQLNSNNTMDLLASAQIGILQRLVEAGADINERLEYEEPPRVRNPCRTPLEYAIIGCPAKIVSQLMAMGASLSTETADADIAHVDAVMDYLLENFSDVYFSRQKMKLLLESGARMDVTLPRVGRSLLTWPLDAYDLWIPELMVNKLLDVATPSNSSPEHIDEAFLQCIEKEELSRICNSFVRHGATLIDLDRAYPTIVERIDCYDYHGRYSKRWLGCVGLPKETIYDLLMMAIRRRDGVIIYLLSQYIESAFPNCVDPHLE
ncbi:ankyrin [Hypoxylon sp. NC0597]|nr:ankyrin [Hypoxylon sp. NC0597]